MGRPNKVADVVDDLTDEEATDGWWGSSRVSAAAWLPCAVPTLRQPLSRATSRPPLCYSRLTSPRLHTVNASTAVIILHIIRPPRTEVPSSASVHILPPAYVTDSTSHRARGRCALSHRSSSAFDLTGVCTINVRRESATCAAASTVVSPVLSHTGDTSTGSLVSSRFPKTHLMLTDVCTNDIQPAQPVQNAEELTR